MDADFSHNPDYLPGLLGKLAEYDCVIGSRYVRAGGVRDWPLQRKIVSRFGNFYARNVLGFPVRDCTAGFMGFRKQVLQAINLDEVKSEGYGFLIEMKYRAYKKGFKIHEHPIIFVDRKLGKSKISKNIIFEAVFLVWKLRLGL
jgi:dolichol-phosphate mannosyltransferase